LQDNGGTAVTVQAMVFGNLDDRSGAGVLFSRNPLTGGRAVFGEWLPGGQGEEVVSGRHDPLPLSVLAGTMPDAHASLMAATETLEREFRDIQDIEFTVEAGRLWLLQSRAAKRSPRAAVRLAVDFEREGAITRSEALDRVTPEHISKLLRDHLDPAAIAQASVVAEGRPACPGLALGTVVTDVDEAERRATNGEDIILARETTNPDDMHAMAVVAGILTEIGGSTSHAAVVSRELGVPCVVGCGNGTLIPLDTQPVTADANEGEVYAGHLPVVSASEDQDDDLRTLAQWARDESGDAINGDVSLSVLLRERAASIRS
jgi:pyruvate,orthophosphate dikinase